MKKIRLGNPDEWKKIIARYRDKELNPHLSLALLASDLPQETLVAVHDRVKHNQENVVVFERN